MATLAKVRNPSETPCKDVFQLEMYFKDPGSTEGDTCFSNQGRYFAVFICTSEKIKNNNR